MRFFVDTANVEQIRQVSTWGIVAGVTTNPSLMAKEGRDPEQVIREIAELVSGPISAEAVATDTDGIIEEGRRWAAVAPQVVVKIPITEAGLAATKVLAEEGIAVNMTLIFTAAQALLAARSGAKFVSPFVGRLDDSGQAGVQVVREIAELFAKHEIDTEIIAASIRRPLDITAAALAGAHIATVPYEVLVAALQHPLTEKGIAAFLAAARHSQQA